jgi:hypothetical protein
METIKAVGTNSFTNSNGGTYWLVIEKDGTLKCSCGRELVKLDENLFVCTGGYPTYRISPDEVVVDKWGNLCLKAFDSNRKPMTPKEIEKAAELYRHNGEGNRDKQKIWDDFAKEAGQGTRVKIIKTGGDDDGGSESQQKQ